MNNNKDNVTIIFGDSITYGLYDKEMCGWTNRIRHTLEKKTTNNYVVNLGIPGENSSNIKDRFETELKNRYNDIDNFILIYAIGIKDALILKNKPDHINIFIENIKYIINKSRNYTNNIYFIGLLEPDYNKRKEYKKDNVYLIDDTLESICKKEQVEYIKMIDLLEEKYLTDGLHPNSIGHEKISNIILNKVYNDKQ